MQPLVSIIIPTYNRAHMIQKTLESVAEQSYQNWECIIVDDGSTDETKYIVGKFCDRNPKFRYFLRPTSYSKGANSCRNYGFYQSKGTFVNWFDDDDVMLENFIATKVNAVHESATMVISSHHVVNDRLEITEKIKLLPTSQLFKDYALWKLKIITGNVMFRRSFVQEDKLFLPQLTRGQETEFFSKYFFQAVEGDYILINEPLFLYRQHPETKTHKNRSYVESYKESQVYVALENFERSIRLKDEDLIEYYYTLLINYFFRGIDNKHAKNTSTLLKEFTPLLAKISRSLGTKFYLFGKLLLFLGRGSYRVEQYFKKQRIKPNG